MASYEWSGHSGYAGYVGKSPNDERRLLWYDDLLGAPLVELREWSPPTVVQYLGDDRKKRKPAPIGDAPRSSQLNMVSQAGASALADIFARHAKLYPVILDDASDAPYFMVIPTTEIDCIDREQSTGKLAKYGPNPHMFAVVEEWVFRENEIGEADMFVLPDSPTTTYVSERFKQRVIEAGLKGFCLKRYFWEEDPFIS